MTSQGHDRPAPESYRFADDGRIPNSRLPVLVYRNVLDDACPDPAEALEALFEAHGWLGAWRDGVYSFHHFHSTTHEVLGVARGWATLCLGGERGASLRVDRGDVLALPAGVGHKHEQSAADFLVVGAYPQGRAWDICRGEPTERPRALANLARVPLPKQDPVLGRVGPLPSTWARAAIET